MSGPEAGSRWPPHAWPKRAGQACEAVDLMCAVSAAQHRPQQLVAGYAVGKQTIRGNMATSLEALEAEVLNLPAAERTRLLDKLLASLDQDRSIEEAWMSEAKRRDDEVESGSANVLSGADVMARLRAGLA